jgi:AraC-type DNA-binding domain-containing proteins
MKSWYKKITPDDTILFYIKRELTESEVAAGIVLNEYNNVATGIEFLDQFAATIKRIKWSTAKDYAILLGLKTNELNIVIKTLTGHTVKAWVEHLVMLGANEMLGKTTKSIGSISRELGFSQQSMFSRFCIQQTGLPPNELRIKIMRMNGAKVVRR